MFGREYTYIFIVLAVLQRPKCSNGKEISICYIRSSQSEANVCVLSGIVMCCNQNLSVDRINVYGKETCTSNSNCGSGNGCCESRDSLNVSREFVASLNKTFRTTNCFKDVSIYRLPFNHGLVSAVVTYSCTGGTTAATDTKPSIPQQTTVPETSTKSTTIPAETTPSTKPTTTTATTDTITETTSTNGSDPSATESNSDDDSKTNVAAAVAVPVVILFIIAVVVAVVFFIRRRRAANKRTDQSAVEPNTFSVNGPLQKSVLDYQHDSALPSSYDEGVNSDYAEIEGNRNSNLFGESNEYNTISPRHLPVANGRIPAGQRATNEDYDHIGIQLTAHSKGTDTYAHIDHSAAKELNVSNGGVVTDMSMYAHAAHNAQQGNGANTEYVGGDTYAHVDHVGKQRQAENTRFNGGDTYAHANHGAIQEGGRYAGEESQYDHTDHHSPTGSLGHYQDGGDYSHVGNLSASRQREDDHNVTNGNQNQRLVSGTKKQNVQESDQHSYFVLEKQFK